MNGHRVGEETWAGLSFTSDEDPVVKNVVSDSRGYQARPEFPHAIVAIDGMRVNASSMP